MTTSPPWSPDTGQACTAAVIGINGYPVEASAAITNGLASFNICGLPDSYHRETRDQVRAAILNSGQRWPGRTITVDLLPASLPKRGSGSDLAITVAVLTASGAIPTGAPDGCVFYAELGLDGSLRPVRGVVPALLAAADAGCTRAVVAAQNAAEAAMLPGLDVISCESLRQVTAWLRHDPFRLEAAHPAAPSPTRATSPPPVSLTALGIPAAIRLGLETSAAGGHHLCLTGPPAARIPALAAGLAAMLPPLTPTEQTEVTAIHSAAGLLGSGHPLVRHPPFCAPHHTTTPAGIAGGGPGITRPGEAALAHRGVLFLDQAPEFARATLTTLRQALQHGEITLARSGQIVRFPARFLLVAGTAPCPCGGQSGCTCSPLQKRRYRARLTGQLGSHIAIWLNGTPPAPVTNGTGQTGSDPDTQSAERVAAARDRTHLRLRDTPWTLNADIPGAELRRSYPPSPEALAPVTRAVDLGEISVRAANQVVRVAWTLADLAGIDRPGPQECGQALAFYLGVSQ
jgi:magnesium chelatase family protein